MDDERELVSDRDAGVQPYNLNCWLLLFQREEGVQLADMPHTTLATARLRFLFVRGQDLAARRAGWSQLQ